MGGLAEGTEFPREGSLFCPQSLGRGLSSPRQHRQLCQRAAIARRSQEVPASWGHTGRFLLERLHFLVAGLLLPSSLKGLGP